VLLVVEKKASGREGFRKEYDKEGRSDQLGRYRG